MVSSVASKAMVVICVHLCKEAVVLGEPVILMMPILDLHRLRTISKMKQHQNSLTIHAVATIESSSLSTMLLRTMNNLCVWHVLIQCCPCALSLDDHDSHGCSVTLPNLATMP